MISAIKHGVCRDGARHSVLLVRQNPERVQRLVAGGSGHGGAVQWYRWVRNRVTDLKEVSSTAMAAQIAGEPEKSKRYTFGRNTKTAN